MISLWRYRLFPVFITLINCSPLEKEVKMPLLFEGLWKGSYDEYVESPHIDTVEIREKTPGELEAVISQLEIPIHSKDNHIDFFSTDRKWGFRGEFSPEKSTIIGHWIQNGYASPLTFRQVNNSKSRSWLGLPDAKSGKVNLFFEVYRDTTDSIRASLFDREYNLGRSYRDMQVDITGDSLVIYRQRDGARVFWGVMRNDSLIARTRFDETQVLYLTRTERSQEPELQPRLTQNYTYIVPETMADGLETTSLNDVDLNQDKILELIEEIEDEKSFQKVHSLLIARHKKLVLEEYFYGYKPSAFHTTRSAGKSITNALVGIAIDRQFIPDENSAVYPYFNKYDSFQNWAEGKNNILIKHILTMSSGLACNDFGDSPGNEDRMQSQKEQPDWSKFILDLPLENRPGEKTFYCSGGVNLLGDLITQASNLWIPEFLQKYLFDPLGIQNYYMNLTPTGNGYLAGGIFLKPRDMLKFGQLYLNHGQWQGEQVISGDWIKKSFQPWVGINGENPDYGYLWWYDRFVYRDAKYDSYSASGNGGQFIFVIPKLDLVVVITGGNYGQFRNWIRFKKMISDYIIPAAISKT